MSRHDRIYETIITFDTDIVYQQVIADKWISLLRSNVSACESARFDANEKIIYGNDEIVARLVKRENTLMITSTSNSVMIGIIAAYFTMAATYYNCPLKIINSYTVAAQYDDCSISMVAKTVAKTVANHGLNSSEISNVRAESSGIASASLIECCDQTQIHKTTCVIYTDGSAKPSLCCGGWGFVVVIDNDAVHQCCGGKMNTTNNQMELTGVVEALKYILNHPMKDSMMIIISSDSQYVINGATKWSKEWERNGWKTSAKEPVLNKEIWVELLSLIRKIPTLQFVWVKGHSGNQYNDIADNLANDGAMAVLSSKQSI
jgi:ribonuclease HI